MQAALSKFGLPCAFLGKSDFFSLSLGNIYAFKKKDVSCRINVMVTSQSNVPFFVI